MGKQVDNMFLIDVDCRRATLDRLMEGITVALPGTNRALNQSRIGDARCSRT